MMTIEKLNALGADAGEGLARCCGSTELYFKLVRMIPGEKSFGRLSAALDGGDAASAFEAAHALKGVLGNLSLTSMYERSARLSELLRAPAREENAAIPAEARELAAELFELRDELTRLCAEG